jgi:acetoin utilization protein AcuC
MPADSAIIYSDAYQKYELSPWHPMKPVRLMLTAELIRAYGLVDENGVRVLEPREASDAELRLVHEQAYIDKVRELSAPGARDADGMGWGLGTGDNPIFVDMHEASATIAGGAIVAADAVMSGEVGHAFHFGGGLHHAQPARASGFCVYNDVAIAAAYLKQRHGARVLYLDFDAHHGDGVQNCFYRDHDVMTVSFHESGRHLFPGSGFTGQIGDGDGKGYAVNLPLEPGTTDEIYLKAYDELVPPLARAFMPDIIITQNGCDAHWSDPLTHLSLTIGGFKELARRQHRLVHEFSGGRWLASGGGGYQAFTVVPRAWTAHTAAMAEVELAEELPESWRTLCAGRSGSEAPRYLTRGDEPEETDRAEIDRAHDAAAYGIAEIKETVFPILGAG